jgi:preprotein translocase subunit YajC
MSAFIAVPSLFLAQGAAPAAPASSPFDSLPIFLFMAVIFYFLLIRPQQKRAKEQAALVSSLKTGDRVVTASGFHGIIANVKDTTVIVKFAENVKIEVDKSAVTGVTKPGADTEAKPVSIAKSAS